MWPEDKPRSAEAGPEGTLTKLKASQVLAAEATALLAEGKVLAAAIFTLQLQQIQEHLTVVENQLAQVVQKVEALLKQTADKVNTEQEEIQFM